MAYRIAVASTDGKVVNEHFGRAQRFLILEMHEDGTCDVIGVRLAEAVCTSGDHEEGAMEKRVELLTDCKYVLVSRIGQRAEHALEEKGIFAFAIPDLIEHAIQKLVSYIEINNLIYGKGE